MSIIRKLAVALLDNDDGICEDAWEILRVLMEESGDCDDIIAAIKAVNGNYYLPYGDWRTSGK